MYGLHACLAALGNGARTIYDVWCLDRVHRRLNAMRLGHGRALGRCHVVQKADLDALVPGNGVHQGIVIKAKYLPTARLEALKNLEKKSQVVVVLDQVTDPQNVGSILRLALAFAADAVIMTTTHGPAETGAMAKVASGALESVPRCFVPNLAEAIRTLRSWGFWSVGLSENAKKPLQAIDLRGKIALVVGSEGSGIRRLTRSLCDFEAFLPTSENFSTLNVTMAAAISLYEVFCAQQFDRE